MKKLILSSVAVFVVGIVAVFVLAGCPGSEIGINGGYNKETGEIQGGVEITIPKKDNTPDPSLPSMPPPVTDKK